MSSKPLSAPRRRWLLAGLALPCALALPGCGFRLRSAPRFAFDSLRIAGSEGTPVAQALRTALQDQGLRVVTSATPVREGEAPPPVVLQVQTDQRERTVVGQTAIGQVRELQLRHRFRFLLRTAAGRELIPSTELLLERDIGYTETAALSKQAEEDLMYRDMQADMVQQVVRRLSALRQLP